MASNTLSPDRGRSRPLFGARLFCLLVALVLLAATLAPTAASAQSASDEATFITLINQVRANNGLAALQPNSQLTTLSRGWAQAQRDGVCGGGQFICHASPISEGVTQDWKKLGENVGTGPTVSAVMDAFIASPGHYANIIDPAFTHIGVGVVWDGNRLYTTHRFMRLEPAAPPTTPAPTTTTTTAAPTTTTAAAPTTAAPAPTAAPTTAAPTSATPLTAPTSTATSEPAIGGPSTGLTADPSTESTTASEALDTSGLLNEPISSTVGTVNVDERRAQVLVSRLQLLS